MQPPIQRALGGGYEKERIDAWSFCGVQTRNPDAVVRGHRIGEYAGDGDDTILGGGLEHRASRKLGEPLQGSVAGNGADGSGQLSELIQQFMETDDGLLVTGPAQPPG